MFYQSGPTALVVAEWPVPTNRRCTEGLLVGRRSLCDMCGFRGTVGLGIKSWHRKRT